MKIRFDTRNKKPKLYDLLILTAVAAVISGSMIIIDPEKYAAALCVTAASYCFFAILMLLNAFVRQIQYNPYSYNTIIYFGFALFALSVMITHMILGVRIFRYPEVYEADQIIYTLLGSAKNYMFLSFPFLAVFSAGLCVSNISLIRHEGRRFVNLLGIILSFLLIGGAVFIFFFDYYATGSQTEVMIHDLITNFIAAVYLYFECMLIGTIVAMAIASRYEPDKDKDFIIILGCGLREDGTPTPLLQGRMDRALEFAENQRSETGKEPIFITSGGQGPNEVVPESTSMKRYLIERGVPADRIIEEDRSTDTFENMQNSKIKIQGSDRKGKIAFSTTNYHVFRSGLFARKVKMRAVGMGAKTKWYFWPNAAVREFAGLLTGHRIKQSLILIGMIVFYITLTLIEYK